MLIFNTTGAQEVTLCNLDLCVLDNLVLSVHLTLWKQGIYVRSRSFDVGSTTDLASPAWLGTKSEG